MLHIFPLLLLISLAVTATLYHLTEPSPYLLFTAQYTFKLKSGMHQGRTYYSGTAPGPVIGGHMSSAQMVRRSQHCKPDYKVPLFAAPIHQLAGRERDKHSTGTVELPQMIVSDVLLRCAAGFLFFAQPLRVGGSAGPAR